MEAEEIFFFLICISSSVHFRCIERSCLSAPFFIYLCKLRLYSHLEDVITGWQLSSLFIFYWFVIAALSLWQKVERLMASLLLTFFPFYILYQFSNYSCFTRRKEAIFFWAFVAKERESGWKCISERVFRLLTRLVPGKKFFFVKYKRGVRNERAGDCIFQFNFLPFLEFFVTIIFWITICVESRMSFFPAGEGGN